MIVQQTVVVGMHNLLPHPYTRRYSVVRLYLLIDRIRASFSPLLWSRYPWLL